MTNKSIIAMQAKEVYFIAIDLLNHTLYSKLNHENSKITSENACHSTHWS
jgi:hypothetical protein